VDGVDRQRFEDLSQAAGLRVLGGTELRTRGDLPGAGGHEDQGYPASDEATMLRSENWWDTVLYVADSCLFALRHLAQHRQSDQEPDWARHAQRLEGQIAAVSDFAGRLPRLTDADFRKDAHCARDLDAAALAHQELLVIVGQAAVESHGGFPGTQLPEAGLAAFAHPNDLEESADVLATSVFNDGREITSARSSVMVGAGVLFRLSEPGWDGLLPSSSQGSESQARRAECGAGVAGASFRLSRQSPLPQLHVSIPDSGDGVSATADTVGILAVLNRYDDFVDGLRRKGVLAFGSMQDRELREARGLLHTLVLVCEDWSGPVPDVIAELNEHAAGALLRVGSELSRRGVSCDEVSALDESFWRSLKVEAARLPDPYCRLVPMRLEACSKRIRDGIANGGHAAFLGRVRRGSEAALGAELDAFIRMGPVAATDARLNPGQSGLVLGIVSVCDSLRRQMPDLP
jgi:hypothetical protein